MLEGLRSCTIITTTKNWSNWVVKKCQHLSGFSEDSRRLKQRQLINTVKTVYMFIKSCLNNFSVFEKLFRSGETFPRRTTFSRLLRETFSHGETVPCLKNFLMLRNVFSPRNVFTLRSFLTPRNFSAIEKLFYVWGGCF